MRKILLAVLCVAMLLSGGAVAEDLVGPFVIGFLVNPPVQTDLEQPVFLQVITTVETERVKIVDDAGNVRALVEAPAFTETEFGRLWSAAVRFDAPYVGGLEAYPGDGDLWNEEGSARILVDARPAGYDKSLRDILPYTGKPAALENTVFDRSGPINGYLRDVPVEMSDALAYMEGAGAKGVLTFRGSNMRQNSAYGTAKPAQGRLEQVWIAETDASPSGDGHAAQPVIIEWSEDMNDAMATGDVWLDRNLREVIFAAESGVLHCFQLETGAVSRYIHPTLESGRPMLSTPSIHPEVPVLAVGIGDPQSRTDDEDGNAGVRVYNIVNNGEMGTLMGMNEESLTGDPTVVTSPLFDAATDTLFTIGSNGLLYSMEMRSELTESGLTIRPEAMAGRVGETGDNMAVDGSMAAYGGHGYYATNAGLLVSVDLNTMAPDWGLHLGADVDAAVAVGINGGKTALYVATKAEVSSGLSTCYRIDAVTGQTDWQARVRGDINASPLIGTGPLAGRVFVTAMQDNGFGVLYAFDAQSGGEIWHTMIPGVMPSSPMAMYDGQDRAWIVQGCESGVMLLSPSNGEGLDYFPLDGTVYGSPAAFHDMIVIATREGQLYALRLR